MEPSPEGPTRVLLAENDDAVRDAISEALRAEGYHVIEVTSGPQLRDWLRPSLAPPDLVISDVSLGLDVMSWLGEHEPALPVILINTAGGMNLYQDRPLDVDDLVCAATLLAEPRQPARPGYQ